ncbi:hypothetical protein ACFQZ4_52455 [Catellatospora coxensis]|uniref:hypothetical protein n=1 Tax=Catellatospora coxensis TaxID=310354 RepID=UPI001942E6B1|nr:hypothetical protein [Catellatospora coxensis]
MVKVDLDGGAVLTTHLAASPAVTIVDPDSERPGLGRLGSYDLFNHCFDIRYALELLFCRVRTASRGVTNGWSPSTRRTVGCGAYLDDRVGSALIHAGAIDDGCWRGMLSRLVAPYPAGEPQRVYAAALDVDVDTDGGERRRRVSSLPLVLMRSENRSSDVQSPGWLGREAGPAGRCEPITLLGALAACATH